MSDSVRSHRWQPTRLPHPWDSPGKNTGVGCHFLLQYMKVKSESKVAQSCLTLSDPMDCSLPGSSMHGIFQARVLEWGAIALGGGKKKCSMSSFWVLVFPGYYKVTVRHHLLLRSPKVSLKHWALLIIYIVPGGLRKSRKSQPIIKNSDKKDNPGVLPGMEGGFTNSSPPHPYWS